MTWKIVAGTGGGASNGCDGAGDISAVSETDTELLADFCKAFSVLSISASVMVSAWLNGTSFLLFAAFAQCASEMRAAIRMKG